jgi:hypothetical protein
MSLLPQTEERCQQKHFPSVTFSPTQLPSNTPTVEKAQNVRPIANGFAPVASFLSVAGSLGNSFVGGGSYVGSDGNSTLLAATPAKLRKYTGTWTDVLSLSTTARWRFAQFGDNLIYANGGQLGSYGLLSGTAGAIATAPSNAIDVCTVKDVVMCLTADSQVKWSDINNSANWTSGQADNQPLLDGGTGVRIIGGEYGIILQKNSIRRVTYTGVDQVWFQFDVISPEIGCMAAGSVTNVGRLIFFLSERGFEMCDGENVTPIGEEAVNRWFFSQFSRADIANIWCAANPRRTEVYWAMPGNPGLVLLYNWSLKRWSYLSISVSGLLNGQTPSTSVDALDATYGNLDAIPLSLDDPTFAGGNPLLLVVDASNTIGSLSGPNLQATIQQQNVELTPGKRSRLRNIRPISDTNFATCSVNVKMRAGDGEKLKSTTSMGLSGRLPIRANGRFFDNSLTIPGNTPWTYIQGCEYEFEAGDGR